MPITLTIVGNVKVMRVRRQAPVCVRSTYEDGDDVITRQKEGNIHITFKDETVENVSDVKGLKACIKRQTCLLCRGRLSKPVLSSGKGTKGLTRV